MDDYLEEDSPLEMRELLCLPFPLDPLDIWMARYEVVRRICKLPFFPDEATRSLWIAFAGEFGVWVQARVPVDDRLDAGDPATIAAKCGLAADLLKAPVSDPFDAYLLALVVLRRPGPRNPSRADRSILRKLDKAAATRPAVPWTFFVATPEDYCPLPRPSEKPR